MSPKLLQIGNVDIVIRTKDHKPAHIHAIAPGAEAKISMRDWEVISSHGFSERTLRKLIAFLREHESLLIEQWRQIHGEG